MEAIRFLGQPLMSPQIKELRKTYAEFQRTSGIRALVSSVLGVKARYGSADAAQGARQSRYILARDDLRLICFDILSG